MEAKQNITLRIDVHTLPLAVKVEQEAFYRRAALILNERFAALRKKMPDSTNAEMIWLYIALESWVNLINDSREKALEPILEKIKSLNTMIDSVLSDSREDINKT